MTNRKKPIAFKIIAPKPFSGEALISFILDSFEKVFRESIPIRYKQLIISDDEGKKFWNKELAVHAVEYMLKNDYNITFLYKKDGEDLVILVAFEDKTEECKAKFLQFVEDLTSPEKKYLLYQRLIKSFNNRSFEEKLAYYQKNANKK